MMEFKILVGMDLPKDTYGDNQGDILSTRESVAYHFCLTGKKLPTRDGNEKLVAQDFKDLANLEMSMEFNKAHLSLFNGSWEEEDYPEHPDLKDPDDIFHFYFNKYKEYKATIK